MSSILFYGELFPSVVHGISICNYNNLAALKVDFDVDVVESSNSESKGNIFKLIYSSIKDIYYLMKSIYREKYTSFYINMPTSSFGLLRIIIIVCLVKFFRRNIKVFSHLHRGDFCTFQSSKLNKLLCRVFFKLTYKLFVLSYSSKMEIINLGYCVDISIIYNTLSYNNSFTFDYEKKPIYILCLCNYLSSKRNHVLIEFSRLYDIRVDFFGNPMDLPYFEGLKKSSAELNISINGSVVGKEKENVISGCKVMVLPSLNEGMPLTILEAFAFSKPVICFDVGYISEYIGEDYPGLVKNNDDKSLYNKIDEIINLPTNEYEELCKRSYEIYINNFNSSSARRKLQREFK